MDDNPVVAKLKEEPVQYHALLAVTNTAESRDGGAYFLFPHRSEEGILGLPPFCCFNYFATEGRETGLLIGHPSKRLEKWNVPKGAREGDKVLLFQGGPPKWRNGLWGEGELDSDADCERDGERQRCLAKVKVTKLLRHPLIISHRLNRKKWSKDAGKVFRLWIGLQVRFPSHQGSFISISPGDYKTLTREPQYKLEEGSRPIPPELTQGSLERYEKMTGDEKFEDSFLRKNLKKVRGLPKNGWPEYLDESDTGDVWAYEVKRDEKDKMTPEQQRAKSWLEENRIRVYLVYESPYHEYDFRKRIEKKGLHVVGGGKKGKTRGWPDFRMANPKVAIECKANNDALKPEQIEVNSTLRRKGIDVRVVRGIEKSGEWTVWDDTERWLGS